MTGVNYYCLDINLLTLLLSETTGGNLNFFVPAIMPETTASGLLCLTCSNLDKENPLNFKRPDASLGFLIHTAACGGSVIGAVRLIE